MARHVIKTFDISDVEPGMCTAKMVLTDTGQLALDAGTTLTVNLIERLKGWGVNKVDILFTFPGDNLALDSIVEATSRATQNFEAFCVNYSNSVYELKKSFSAARALKEVSIEEMRKMTGNSIDQLINASGVVNHLHMVKRQDDYTFHHSVNVAVISGVLGKWLGYFWQNLKDLILSGLVYDIGKTLVPLEILNKTGRLTDSEMEVMKIHTTLGYQMICNSNIPQSVMLGLLQHNERSDGSGYPLRVRSNKIHEFAKIIAVADIFDAITSDRVYRAKVSPFTVVDMITKEMYDKLDPIICTTFLNNVRDYFVGNVIQLSTGQEAEVIYMGHFSAARPVVRTSEGVFIDLENQKDISIVKLIKT